MIKLKALVLLSFFTLTCTPSRMLIKKENEIKNYDHGYIILNFHFNKLLPSWKCIFIVNDEVYFDGVFANHHYDKTYVEQNNDKIFQYKFPVPAGNLTIKYFLYSNYGFSDEYGTSDIHPIFCSSCLKDLNLEVKKGEEVRLVILDKNEKINLLRFGCAAPIFPILPYRKTHHGVEFIVEKK